MKNHLRTQETIPLTLEDIPTKEIQNLFYKAEDSLKKGLIEELSAKIFGECFERKNSILKKWVEILLRILEKEGLKGVGDFLLVYSYVFSFFLS